MGKNGVLAVCNTVVLTLFGATLDVAAFVWIAENQIGFLNQFEMPFWLAALIASIPFDAWLYVWHQLNHVLPFFWRFHQVHYSDLKMDFSIALRFHPGEILFSSIVNIVVYAILGISIENLVIDKIVFNIKVLWNQSNVALSEKWDWLLRAALVSPSMHRVHHSMKVKEINSNYSSVRSIWDCLFGSYRFSDPKKIVFGLDYDREAEEKTIARLLSRPFKPKNDR